jgi:flagellin
VGLSVVSNTTAMSAHRSLGTTDRAMAVSLERLSSGLRINRAADDAAGLAISEGLRSRIGGMRQAVRNTQDGISFVQTAEGALAETTSVLQRMRDLAVQAANTGGLDGAARSAVQLEVQQLKAELTRIADTTAFNGRRLLDGTYDGTFQVGADVGETLTVGIAESLSAGALGVDAIDVTRDLATVHTMPARGREPAVAGTVRIEGAADLSGGIAALQGTVVLGTRSLDLGTVPHAPGGDATVALAELNAAAASAGFPSDGGTGPFALDGGALVLRGPVPADSATPADVTAATPEFHDPTPPNPPSVSVTSDPPRAGRPPSPGMVWFTRSGAGDVPAFLGTIAAAGGTLQLGSLATVPGDDPSALARLNAAAEAAGMDLDDPFGHGYVLSDGDGWEEGPAIVFRGPVPSDTATADEIAAATPVYTPGPGIIGRLDEAIRAVSTQRADLGAVQNRFEHTLARLGVSLENATAAESRIRDTDMAAEMTRFTRVQVLNQAGTAMLAQANQSAQSLLRLLQG